MGVPAPHRASTDTSLAGEGLKGLLPAPRWLPLTTGVGAGGSENDRGLGWGGEEEQGSSKSLDSPLGLPLIF